MDRRTQQRDYRDQQRGYRDQRGGPQEQFIVLGDSPAHDSLRQNTRSTRNHTLDQRYELRRFRLRLLRDGGPGRPLGISPDFLLYDFQLGCEDRKLIVRRYYRIILRGQWLNVILRNHRFQRYANGHALGRQWRHLLDRPDILGDCPVGESRAIGLRFLLQLAIMVLLQYINSSQESLERSLVQNWLALRAGWFLLHVGG